MTAPAPEAPNVHYLAGARTYTTAGDIRTSVPALNLARPMTGPNGPCWLLVAGRRGGKTWALQALEHAFAQDGRPTQLVDLQRTTERRASADRGKLVLVDEPGNPLSTPDGRDDLLRWCASLRSDGAKVVVAVTPGQCATLFAATAQLAPDRKDVVYLNERRLTAEETARMAARCPDWAPAVLERLRDGHRAWTRTPFLLELLLGAAERHPSARDDPDLLAGLARRDAGELHYLDDVFDDGLDGDHRAVLRRRQRPDPVPEHLAAPEKVLDRCGLLDDPIIAGHLPPALRIHHVSDLHFGAEAATVDAKAPDPLGQKLAAAAGAGPVPDHYLNRLAGAHLLVVSGDLTDRATPGELEAARAWVDRAAERLADHPCLNDGEPRVLLAGGNHDVDWGAAGAGDDTARHKAFAAAFAERPHPNLHQPAAERDLARVDYPGAELSVVLLGSAELGGEHDPGPAGPPAGGDRRADPGLVADEVIAGIEHADWTRLVTVAVVHHPVSPLPQTEIAPYAGLLNAGRLKSALLGENFALVLHGHAHLGRFGRESWSGGLGAEPQVLHVASAPSLGAAYVDSARGYNEIEIVLEGCHTAVVTLKRWELAGLAWTLADELSFERRYR